jgi:hypothetical protein
MKLLLGRIAMAAAILESGGELADEHRWLIERPEAKAITTRRKVLARAIVRDAAEFVDAVLSGELALKSRSSSCVWQGQISRAA